MSPESLLVVPTTCWEEMARPPSLMSVQSGPRLPLARLKSSVAIPDALVVQVTETFVTSAEAMEPEPSATVQVCPVGLVCTVTL